MTRSTAHDPKRTVDAPTVSERFALLRSKVSLGALKRSLRPGITAAMIVEEGCIFAEKEYDLPGLAVAGAIASEVLWAYQLDQERRDREGGAQR